MSLFSSLKPKAQLSRDVFDLSRTETFSVKTGGITPVFVQHTLPDGIYKIDLSNIVRVDEMKQANFVGVSQNVEFVFVPYSQLWKPFNRFYYERGEETRTPVQNTNPSLPKYVPTFGLRDVINAIVRGIVAYEIYVKYIEVWNSSTTAFATLTQADILAFAAGKGVALDSTHPEWFSTEFVDIHGLFSGYEQLRTLDMLGYGNYLPVIKTFVNFFTTLISTPSDATLDSMNTLFTSIYATWSGTQSPVNFSSQIPDERPNVFAIAAYNKVFNDIYKNREYDYAPYNFYYNFDWFTGLQQSSFVPTSIVLNGLKRKYKQYKKDMFTGLYPNPQFGDVAVASYNHPTMIINALTREQSGAASFMGTNDATSIMPAGSLYSSGITGSTNWNIDSKISALAIRQAEALQRYKERIVRAGNREKDLQEAVFGVSSKYIQDEYADFLGSFQGSLQNNPVAATADTDNAVVGQLGSYSVGSISLGQQREIEYMSHDFGIIIGLMYILPETKYEALGIHPQNTKFEKLDYYNPAFQNLGLAPVYSTSALNIGSNFGSLQSKVLGYLARYFEYKTEVSHVHGEFFASTPNWVNGLGTLPNDWASRSGMVARFGSFSDFAAPRDVNNFGQPTLQSLYVNPADLDSVFYTSYRPEIALDHFKVEMSFQVKAVLPMSTTGLPSY